MAGWYSASLVPARLLVALLLGVSLEAPFAAASGVAERSPNGIIVTLELSLTVDKVDAVVAHVLAVGTGSQRTIALGSIGGRSFGASFEVAAHDAPIVFEISRAGKVTSSDRTSLRALGVDPVLLGLGETPPAVATSEGRSLGWLAVGLGAAALALLVLWAWWPGRIAAASTQAVEAPGAEPTDERSARR